MFLASVEKTFYSNDPFEPYSLDDYLGEFGDQYGSYKFIIKSQYAEELMRLLQNRFYSASSIFPSIEGCVQSVYEKNKAK